MKRIFINEEHCLGCRLCEYNCAFANSGKKNMAKALRNKVIHPRICVEETDGITFPVNCRQCEDPICVKSCIAGALSKEDGVVVRDASKCVSCFTCVLVCPFGAVSSDGEGGIQKCELCVKNACGSPACVAGCPNGAIVYEER
jgi:carbon-monoxide dehydrogenase iron sulfur subunit